MRPLFAAILIGCFAISAQANEADDRKARSLAILSDQNVPSIEHLPTIDTEAESIRRDTDDVVNRAIALAIVAVKGETRDDALVQSIIQQFGAETYFSPAEQAYLDDPNPATQTHIQFVWRYEAAFVMLWALGLYDTLSRPDGIVDVGHMVGILRDHGTTGLRNAARLRSQSGLLDAADLIYRYHWATTDARVNGREIPDWMQPSVIFGRHYALNWLVGYLDQPWDDISTDT